MHKVTSAWVVGLGVVICACDEPFYCDQPLSCDVTDAGQTAVGEAGFNGSGTISESETGSDPQVVEVDDESGVGPDGGEAARNDEILYTDSTEGAVSGSDQKTSTAEAERLDGSMVSTGAELIVDASADAAIDDALLAQSEASAATDGGTDDLGPTESLNEPADSATEEIPDPSMGMYACSTPEERKCIGNVAWQCQSAAWTEVETCTAGCVGDGVCVGLCDSVMCLAPMCKEAGACDPETGSCSEPTNADDDSSCDDGNKCTQTDSCQSGSCVGSDPVTCATAAVCRVAGTCDPASGSCSAPTNAPNGDDCDDGNDCTENDSCQGGACSGSQIFCNDPPACKLNTTCSAGECNYTESVPEGTKDTKCPSDTMYCSSGNCVRCVQDAHCSGSAPTCDLSSNTCTCRAPSASNLLQNPGLDGSYDGWNSQGVLTLSDDDSESCSDSNSVRVTVTGGSTAFQCVPITPGQYYLGGRFKGGSGVAVFLTFYSGNCGSNSLGAVYLRPTPPTDSWEADSISITVPSGVNSAYFSVYTETALYMDQLYVSSVNGF